MHRQCAAVPTSLKNAFENGSFVELLEDVRDTVRRVGGRLFFPEKGEDNEAVARDQEENGPEGTTSSSSSQAPVRPAGGLGLEARAPTWAKKKAEPMLGTQRGVWNTCISMLTGVVKVYVKAEELELASFSDVYATFEEQSFSLLVLSDGRVWRLQGRLFGPDDIDPQQLWSLATNMKSERGGDWHMARVENLTWRLRNMWSKNGQESTEESVSPLWRDKDPPPSFDGDTEKFKGYLRELKVWRHETDVPAKKHAVKMLRRLFWKCARRICNFFEWDPQEIQEIQRKLLQEQEDAEVKRWEAQEEAERQHMIQKTMEVAETRRQEILEATQAQHQWEVESLKNQLLWMSAVAGEARMEEVFKNPVLQQEMMNKAMAMKEELRNQEVQAQRAPTVTTATLSVVLQIAASSNWKAAVGDLKNAFMQSDKLVRPAGRLFCKQPRGGLPGLQEGQLIEILAGAYGLGDAPAHWRKSLKKALFQCGFQQSSMDPCVFKSFKEGKLRGLLAVEVDDLFGAGDEYFFQQMEALRKRFGFGKFARLEDEEAGVGFNGRRIKQKGAEFLIDMEKFVSERLHPVKLAVGRATKAKEDATSEEKDLVLRENAKLSLRIQAIPMSELCWGVVTDASYANVSKGKSQGAYAVVAMDKKILTTGVGRCNVLHWRSGKIHWLVNSTLAAETQALSRGLSELSWTVTVRNEFTNEAFDMRQWEVSLRKQRLSALVSESSERALAENLSIVDAKSLYDHLSRETIGTTNDKRTALEMQIIRQTLAETRTQIKWVPHPKMIVDSLTKRHGNAAPLLQLLREGVLRLTDATDINKKIMPAVNEESLDVSCLTVGRSSFERL
eukprot:g747.t1